MAIRPYLSFAARYPRFLAFGVLAAFASSFGQTYFIGVFGPSIQKTFDLGHSEWAALYLAATLTSAAILPWSGKKIDEVDLRRYTVLVAVVLCAGAAVLSAARGPITLYLALLLLRQGGQGLMSHLSVTAMARYFERERGRAIAIATMGFSLGEATLPITALFVIARLDWRTSYGGIAAFIAVVIAPTLLLLLRGHGERHRRYQEDLADAERSSDGSARSWTRGEVLRDPRFFLLLPGVTAPALIITAMFFNHLHLASEKGWDAAWITGNYAVFAVSATAVGLSCGPLIDRFGGVRLVPLMLLPMAVALGLMAAIDAPAVALVYFVGLGASVGIAHTAVSAMWAEVYGVGSLGAIRGLVSALAVFASALGPVVAGAAMDGGWRLSQACWLFAGYALLGTILIAIALRAKATDQSSAMKV